MRRWVGARPPAMVTADDLLARTGHARVIDIGVDDVQLPAGMLADLHHPFLIITPDYVGPPRRVPGGYGRRENDVGPGHRVSARTEGWRLWASRRSPIAIGPLLAVVALTAAAVAPLTLAVAHWVAH